MRNIFWYSYYNIKENNSASDCLLANKTTPINQKNSKANQTSDLTTKSANTYTK